MDNTTIDRDMAHVILGAFSVAELEGMCSLVSENNFVLRKHFIHGKPKGKDYATAEQRVLQLIYELYPDIASQYFDIKKQPKL